MKIRQISFLLIVLSTAALLAGCSGGGQSNQFVPTPTPTPAPSPTPAPTPTPTPTPSLTVSLNASPASLQINARTSLTATVTNDSQNAGVTWTVSCSMISGGCGSFSASTTASGAATSFIAPAAVPTNSTVTVTATSVTDTAISASAHITITPPALADGTYEFRLAGQDSATNPPGPFFAAGAFTVANGTITGGEQDFIDVNGAVSSTSLGGSVGGTADGNFQATLTGTGAGVNGTETLNGNLLSTTNTLITEFDSFATAEGVLQLQTTPVAAPSAGYAFEVTGLDGNASRAIVGLGGVINMDGSGTISGNGSVFDINDASLPAPLENQTFTASTLTSPDAFGRVEFSLVPSSSSGIAPINLVGYIENPQHIVLVETSDKFGGVMGGTAFSQGASTGKFSTASIAGSSFVFSTSGEDANGPLQLAGLFTTNADGTVSGTVNFNDLTGTSAQAPINVSGTYNVDATGRVTMSNISGGSSSLQLYLSGKSISTGISMVNGAVLAGQVFLQTGGGSFTAASFSGTYSMIAHGFDMKSKLTFNSIGPSSADGVGALTATVDQNVMKPPPMRTVGIAASGAFTANANGVFTGILRGLDVSNGQNTGSFTYYVVDTTRVIAIETDPNQLTLIDFSLHR